MKRLLFFAYSVIVYTFFLGTFLYAIGFVGNFHFGPWHGLWLVPKSMDLGGEGAPAGKALVIDALLLAVFALQHSGMARRGFKEKWTKIVPRPIERSTYVLCASGALALLFALWRPIGAPVWATADHTVAIALLVLSLVGWATVLAGTFHISHFDLFGLRQAFHALVGREPPAARFVTPGLYRLVRHPIYMGFVIAFWATPVMTVGHLVFAIATTGYILVAIQLEERDLVREHGRDYERYRREVPMLAPLPKRSDLTERAKMQS
jgi:protein-S-isoprenylcysteine O-methyltransferase Ste14